MINWHIETRDISSLRPYHKNARFMTESNAAHLKTSIKKFGLIDKPIINTDGTIVGGHQRINIFKKGRKTIECWVPDKTLDEKEIEELNIRLNKNTGDWDWDILANQWELEEMCSWGFAPEEFLGKPQFPDEEENSPEKKKKKKKACPNCGHEY